MSAGAGFRATPKLREARMMRTGISLGAFAKKIGLSISFLSLVENRHKRLGPHSAGAYVKAIGFTLEEAVAKGLLEFENGTNH